MEDGENIPKGYLYPPSVLKSVGIRWIYIYSPEGGFQFSHEGVSVGGKHSQPARYPGYLNSHTATELPGL